MQELNNVNNGNNLNRLDNLTQINRPNKPINLLSIENNGSKDSTNYTKGTNNQTQKLMQNSRIPSAKPQRSNGLMKVPLHKINHMIKASEVRVIHEDGEEEKHSEVLQLSKALELALQLKVDLIEISPKATPPVCKLMDYGKFIYREHKNQKRGKNTKNKEIGCHVNIAEHDLETKIRHAEEFLSHSHQVVFKVQFRGREAAHKEIGIDLLKRIQSRLEQTGYADGNPMINGKIAMLRFSPKKQIKP